LGEKKKLLLITPIYPPLVGGAATNYNLLVREFQKCESLKKIYILTEYARGQKLIKKEDKTTIYRLLPPRASSNQRNLPIRLVRFIFTQIILIFLLPLFSFLKKVDIIHFHLLRFLKINFKYHNFLFHFLLRLLTAKTVGDAQDQFSIPRYDGCLDKLICGSENIYEKALENRLDSDKCAYIPIPFKKPDLQIKGQHWNVQELMPFICFVGDISKSKGIYELVEAFEIFSDKDPKYHLLLVGENKEGSRFLKCIEKSSKIKYLGAKLHEEALKIIKSSGLLVLPSKSEGLPRVCLEAMALGKKVICPPGVPEFKKYCSGFVISKITAKAISSKIIEVLSCDKFPEYPFKNHDPKKIAKKYLEVYESV